MRILKEECLVGFLFIIWTYILYVKHQLFLASWNYSERTFCCCRNSCHYTHLLYLSLQYQTPVFTRNLPFTSSLPGFRYPVLQATNHLEVLGEHCVWKPSSSHPSGCQQLSLAALLGESGHLRHKGPFPQIHSQTCERVCNYCFTAKLVPSPTKIHGMQKELQKSLCCSKNIINVFGLSFWDLWHDDDVVVTEQLGSICAPM